MPTKEAFCVDITLEGKKQGAIIIRNIINIKILKFYFIDFKFTKKICE